MPDINPKEIDARINALIQQRNQAMDQVVLLAGQMALLQERLDKLECPAPSEP